MVLKRINFPFTELKDIDTFKTSEHIEFESEAIRQLVKMGLLVFNMKHKINDENFLNEIKQATNAETMFEYLESLPENQLQALGEAVHLTRENRFKQAKLV
jgi:hypothetical protein